MLEALNGLLQFLEGFPQGVACFFLLIKGSFHLLQLLPGYIVFLEQVMRNFLKFFPQLAARFLETFHFTDALLLCSPGLLVNFIQGGKAQDVAGSFTHPGAGYGVGIEHPHPV